MKSFEQGGKVDFCLQHLPADSKLGTAAVVKAKILSEFTLFSRNEMRAATPTPQGPDRLRRRVTRAE